MNKRIPARVGSGETASVWALALSVSRFPCDKIKPKNFNTIILSDLSRSVCHQIIFGVYVCSMFIAYHSNRQFYGINIQLF